MEDDDLLREVDELGENLTSWEVGFVADLIDRSHWALEHSHFSLTDAQREKLEEIHEARVPR